MAAKSTGNGRRAKYREGERHKELLKFASSLRHKGVDGAPFEAALLAYNLENCEPPQDEADVRRIARDYAEKPEDAAIAQAAGEVRDLKLASLGELCATLCAREGAAREGPTLSRRVAPGGTAKNGKSWLLLQLALAVAECGTFLGFDCQAQAPEVLCVFGEDDNARIQSRLAALGVASAPRNTHVVNQRVLFDVAKRYAPTFTFAEFLELWLERHPEVRLVLLDTEATCRQVWEGERGQEHGGSRVIEPDYKQTRTFDELALHQQMVIRYREPCGRAQGRGVARPARVVDRAAAAVAGVSGRHRLSPIRPTPTPSTRKPRPARTRRPAAGISRRTCS